MQGDSEDPLAEHSCHVSCPAFSLQDHGLNKLNGILLFYRPIDSLGDTNVKAIWRQWEVGLWMGSERCGRNWVVWNGKEPRLSTVFTMASSHCAAYVTLSEAPSYLAVIFALISYWFSWCSNRKRQSFLYCRIMVHTYCEIHVIAMCSEMCSLWNGEQLQMGCICFSVCMCVLPCPGLLLGMLPALSSSFLYHRSNGRHRWGLLSVWSCIWDTRWAVKKWVVTNSMPFHVTFSKGLE